MNICILDAETLGSDIDLSVFERFGKVTVYKTTKPDEVGARVENQDIVIVNKVVLNEQSIGKKPGIKMICVAATGINNIDLTYAGREKIAISNVAGYSTDSVVQQTFAMLFHLLGSTAYYDQYVKSGRYSESEIFTHLGRSFWELRDKTWGIIGLGTIGGKVADIARTFGCNVVYYSTSGQNLRQPYDRLELDDLLQVSDVLSIHAPLNDNTRNIITYEKFKLMKKHAFLLNLGRGGIVNEADLALALDEDLIAGAGLDVLAQEPIMNYNPLLSIRCSEKLLITPHIAWASVEARQRLIQEITLNIEAFLRGETRNRVDQQL